MREGVHALGTGRGDFPVGLKSSREGRDSSGIFTHRGWGSQGDNDMKSKQLDPLGRGNGELPCTEGPAGAAGSWAGTNRGHGVREGRVKTRKDLPLTFPQELDVNIFGAKLPRRKEICGFQMSLSPAPAPPSPSGNSSSSLKTPLG